MSFVKFHVPTEVRKALKGEKTKVHTVSLFHAIAPEYLDMVDAEGTRTNEQKSVDELERLFRLEDPRRN